MIESSNINITLFVQQKLEIEEIEINVGFCNQSKKSAKLGTRLITIGTARCNC